MSYAAEITRTNPTYFVSLVDHSSSMLDPFGGQAEKAKSEGVADAINRLLQNLILKCAKSDGIRDYFLVGVIGYGGRVASALGGGLVGQTLVSISAIANNPLRVEHRTNRSTREKVSIEGYNCSSRVTDLSVRRSARTKTFSRKQRRVPGDFP